MLVGIAEKMADEVFSVRDGERTGVVVAAVFVSLAGLLLFWILRFAAMRDGRHRLPPGPRGWPLLGALTSVGEFPHRSFYEFSQKYGPVMYMRLGSVSALVVSDADMAKEVFQTNDLLFATAPPLLVIRELTYGLQDIAFAPYGPHWRQVRKIANLQLLTVSKLNSFMGSLWDEIMDNIHNVLDQSQFGDKNDRNVNMSALFNGMAMNVMTRMMWNRRHRNIKSGQSHRDQKFVELIKKMMELGGANNIADFLPPFLQSIAMKLSGLAKKAKDLHKDMDEFCESIICEKEEALSRETKAATDEDDFVTVLLKLMNEPADSEGLSRDSMKAILTDMIIAGSDTTSVTLDWIFSELMRHPDIMKKVQDELANVVGEDRLVSQSDIPNLKYLDAVIKEALRHHSPVPLALHLARADCKVGGYDVPANTWTFFNIFALHHDSSVWELPWEFNPDRFLQSQLDYKGRNYEYLPFATGRRMCPGLNLASTFVHMAAAQLLHTVRWSLPEGYKPETVDMSESSGLVLCRANPLLLNAEPRLARHIIYPTLA